MAVSTDVKLSTLSYVILYVKDTEKALPFYRDTLGLKVKNNDPGWVELDTGAVTLALHSHENMSKNRSDSEPLMVFEVSDIYAAYEAFKAKGVKFCSEPKTVCEAEGKAYQSADFQDADGNRLSIYGYTKK